MFWRPPRPSLISPNPSLGKSIRVGTNRNDCVGTTAVPARIDTVVPTPDHGRGTDLS
jgi:hypothetical protein